MTEPVAGREPLDLFDVALREDDAEQLYERAPCGYLSTAPDGTIVKVNQTFLTLTGYERHDLIGRRRFAELLTPGGRIYHETHYAPLLVLHGRARGIALEIVRSDRQRVPVLVDSVLEFDGNGQPVVVRTAIFDATERRQYEQELLLAKRRAEESEKTARALARTLQQTLIPPEPPSVPGLDVAAVYRPAGDGTEVGGDFYDVFAIASGDWAFVIGDVCGKGASAAVVTAIARHTLRAAAVGLPSPSGSLHVLNEVLLGHDTDRFCTAVVLRMRLSEGVWSATASIGGHPLPLLSRAGAAPTVLGRPGSLVGVLRNPSFVDTDLTLRRGDTLILYTDGVTEGRIGGEFYGEDRLEAVVAAWSGTAASLAQEIVADVLRYQADRPQDDIAVLTVRVPV